MSKLDPGAGEPRAVGASPGAVAADLLLRTPHGNVGRMRVAAIDLGTVRVGLAVSDELGLMAHPRPHLQGGNGAALLDALAELVVSERIERFLVGLPRLLDGSEGRGAREARRFAAALGRRTRLEVTLCDEWLSTREAHERLRQGGHDARNRRERVDSAAAAVLLQSWLDARGAAAARGLSG